MYNAAQQTPRVLGWSKAVRAGEWKLAYQNRQSTDCCTESVRIEHERLKLAGEFPDSVSKLMRFHAKTISRR
jgi:hypothetical protein